MILQQYSVRKALVSYCTLIYELLRESETNEWSKKLSQTVSTDLVCNIFQQNPSNFIFTFKVVIMSDWHNYIFSIKTFLTCLWSQYWKSGTGTVAVLLCNASLLRPAVQRLQLTWQHHVILQLIWIYTSQSCAPVLPQELSHWFCSQNLHLPSRE